MTEDNGVMGSNPIDLIMQFYYDQRKNVMYGFETIEIKRGLVEITRYESRPSSILMHPSYKFLVGKLPNSL